MTTSTVKAVRGARQFKVKKYDGLYNIVYTVSGYTTLYPYNLTSYDTLRKASVAKNKVQARENARVQAKAARAKAAKVEAKAAGVKAARAKAAGKPIKSRLTKTALVSQLETDSGVDAKSVKAVLAALEDAITRSIAPKGAGTFALPGMFIINTKKVKARKGGKIATSPFTGESYMTKDKPASIKVRVRVGAKLKQAASA